MDLIYEEKCGLLLANYSRVKKGARWEDDLSRHFVALHYTMENRNVNMEEINKMKKYIKSKAGFFSNFRGSMFFILAGLLSTLDNGENQFDKILEYEKILKKAGFKSSMYLATAAYTFSVIHNGEGATEYAIKAKEKYLEMRKKHPILTSGDDYALALLLADSDHDMDELDEYYVELANMRFRKGNGLQMLAHILATGNLKARDGAKRCDRLLENIRNRGFKVSAQYYPVIGVLALLDNSEIEKEFTDIVDFLRKQKGYRMIGKGMNMLIASSLIASNYIENSKDKTLVDATLSVTVQAIIAAQQAAMIAAISASAAASSASS